MFGVIVVRPFCMLTCLLPLAACWQPTSACLVVKLVFASLFLASQACLRPCGQQSVLNRALPLRSAPLCPCSQQNMVNLAWSFSKLAHLDEVLLTAISGE